MSETPEPKSIAEYFAEWHSHVFGFGYGSGEEHILPALSAFLAAIPHEGPYDYKSLEEAVTPAVAWLLINALCHADIIEYGTSPRYGWLTKQGRALRDFVIAQPADTLYETARLDNLDHCAPEFCNCGPTGYTPTKLCHNPFWIERPPQWKRISRKEWGSASSPEARWRTAE